MKIERTVDPYVKESLDDFINIIEPEEIFCFANKIMGRQLTNIKPPRHPRCHAKGGKRLLKMATNIAVLIFVFISLESMFGNRMKTNDAVGVITKIKDDKIKIRSAEISIKFYEIYKSANTKNYEVFAGISEKIPDVVSIPITTIEPTKEPVVEIPKVIEPCVTSATPYTFESSESCTKEEVHAAYLESERLFEELMNAAKEEGKRLAREVRAEHDEMKAKWAESDRRRYNPTPEEKAEDKLEMDRFMDKKFKGWAGYRPRVEAASAENAKCPSGSLKAINLSNYTNLSPIELSDKSEINPACKDHAELILGVAKGIDMSSLKKRYRTLSLDYHPDKNKSEGANHAFHLINAAYETLSV